MHTYFFFNRMKKLEYIVFLIIWMHEEKCNWTDKTEWVLAKAAVLQLVHMFCFQFQLWSEKCPSSCFLAYIAEDN